jgi:hypothetical protein
VVNDCWVRHRIEDRVQGVEMNWGLATGCTALTRWDYKISSHVPLSKMNLKQNLYRIWVENVEMNWGLATGCTALTKWGPGPCIGVSPHFMTLVFYRTRLRACIAGMALWAWRFLSSAERYQSCASLENSSSFHSLPF